MNKPDLDLPDTVLARPPRPGECPAKCEVPCKSWLHCATRKHQHNLCTCGMRQTTCICGKPKNVAV